MKKALQFACAVLLLVGGSAPLRAGEVIDRIVATVNGAIILQSDVEDAVRYGALAEGHPVQSLTDDERKAALDRLIDQQLLREQMGVGRFRVQPAAVRERVDDIRKQYAGAEDPSVWRALLQRYGLNEQDLNEYVTAQLQLLRYIDLRLRPGVQVDRRSIETYYHDKFLPELHRRGSSQDVPLAQVYAEIEEVLIQQQLDVMLGNWLRTLRQQSVIRTELPVYGPSSVSPSLQSGSSLPTGILGLPTGRPGGGGDAEAEAAQQNQ